MGGAPGGAPVGGGAAPMQMQATSAPMADNLASMLCYLLGFITGIIFLVMQPYNRNPVVRFHAFQSIFLSIGCIAVSWGLSILFLTIGFWSMFSLLMLIRFAMFILFLFMMFQAYQGKTVVLPLIGSLAQQQSRG
ncbi:MAG TPA: hypothetical protein VKE70_25975 [Candidatus Solibacter sp.]|nr:hypothetical protein [Candidatus Solibacter sp.]